MSDFMKYMDDSPTQVEINMIMDMPEEERKKYVTNINAALYTFIEFLSQIRTSDQEFYDAELNLLRCYVIYGIEHVCKRMGYDLDEVTGSHFADNLKEEIEKDAAFKNSLN